MLPTLYYAAILSFHVPWVAASYWLYSSRVLIELFYWWVLVKLFSLVCVWKGVGDKGWELVVCHLADITWHAVLKCNFVFGCRHLDFYLDYSLGLLKYVSPLSHSSFLLMWVYLSKWKNWPCLNLQWFPQKGLDSLAWFPRLWVFLQPHHLQVPNFHSKSQDSRKFPAMFVPADALPSPCDFLVPFFPV